MYIYIACIILFTLLWKFLKYDIESTLFTFLYLMQSKHLYIILFYYIKKNRLLTEKKNYCWHFLIYNFFFLYLFSTRNIAVNEICYFFHSCIKPIVVFPPICDFVFDILICFSGNSWHSERITSIENGVCNMKGFFFFYRATRRYHTHFYLRKINAHNALLIVLLVFKLNWNCA